MSVSGTEGGLTKLRLIWWGKLIGGVDLMVFRGNSRLRSG